MNNRTRRKRARLAVLAAVSILVIAACDDSSGGSTSRDDDVTTTSASRDGVPSPPDEEPIEVSALPLPPTAPTGADGVVVPGGCTNPTGCLSPDDKGIQEGPSYLWDGEHVALPVVFAGAADGSAFAGEQVILVKTGDGATFDNGDAWKCLTCGVPEDNQVGRKAAVDHPQPFRDGTRLLLGSSVLDCGDHELVDEACTPDAIHIYPIRWNITADGSGDGGSMRELRLSPDGVTLGWSHLSFKDHGVEQFAFVGRLTFDDAPTSGTPLVPRYDLDEVIRLFTSDGTGGPFLVDEGASGAVEINPSPSNMGELRGFSSDGSEVFGINSPAESSHVDVFATNLATGKMRRLTATEYTDPVKASPDDQWLVDLDVHESGRSMFVAGMDGLPPISDLVTVATVSESRNNHNRRFFQPMLIDRWGQRGDYVGQQINAGGDTTAGGISDPNWNARADPAWSPDGTKIVYWQALVTDPSCGGTNPLPCPTSTEPGERRTRLMIADLTSRKPVPDAAVPEPVTVGEWATPYVAGEPDPVRPTLPEGTHTLSGKVSGSATINVDLDENGVVHSVEVTFDNYSDEQGRTFDGTERAERTAGNPYVPPVIWNADITMTGDEAGTKVTTTSDGAQGAMTMSAYLNDFQATGSMTTTIDGTSYNQPANGT